MVFTQPKTGLEKASTFDTKRSSAVSVSSDTIMSVEEQKTVEDQAVSVAPSVGPAAEIDVEANGSEKSHQEWKPSQKEWFIMVSLAIVSLMVALDATILVAVLPVHSKNLLQTPGLTFTVTGNSFKWNILGRVLGWHLISPY